MHNVTHFDHPASAEASTKATRGLVMNWGWPYDLLVWFFDTLLFRGKLRDLRHTAADLARLRPGEAALDVGCRTGNLAVIAKQRVGDTGRVAGIDPGPRQIARARSKAARQGVAIDFQVGVIERLPFPDRSFDAALSTLMMHHLPDDLKQRGLSEIVRVLKPGGRLVIVDLKRPPPRRGRRAGLGAGQMGIDDQPALMQKAGFVGIESGELLLPRFPGIPGAFALGRTGTAEPATTGAALTSAR